MLFVAANDLLTMFVALEVLSLPLYLMCALARRRRLLSPGGGGQVLPARRVRLGVLPVRHGAALRLRGLGRPRRDPRGRVGARAQSDMLLFAGLALLVVGLLFKAGAAPFHVWTPDVYQGAPTPVTAFMAACTKVAAFGAILRVLYVGVRRHPVGLARRCSWAVAIVIDGGRRGPRPDPDRHQAACWPTRRSRTPASCWSALIALHRAGRVEHAVLPAGLRLHDDRRVRAWSPWCATPTARPPTCPSGPAWRGARRWWPRCSRFLLLALAGIPLTSGFTGKFAVFRAGYRDGRRRWS